MSQTSKIFWLHALSPLHAGTGRGVGFIDLPIMREQTTGWPIVPGSTIKGVIADYYRATESEREKVPMKLAAFGRADPEGKESGSSAGALSFTDARIICLPVRSLYGTFAWATSPLALKRLKRELAVAKLDADIPDQDYLPEQNANVTNNSILSSDIDGSPRMFLEDLDFKVEKNTYTDNWANKLANWIFPEEQDLAWQQEFIRRFVILPQDSFDFLCETATEVNARIRIEPEKKIVVAGALWYEESLPVETILGGLVWCDRSSIKGITERDILASYCQQNIDLQLGGKASVGKGRVRCLFSQGDENAYT